METFKTNHSSKAHSDELDRETNENLIAEVASPSLVVEERELLDDEDVLGSRGKGRSATGLGLENV